MEKNGFPQMVQYLLFQGKAPVIGCNNYHGLFLPIVLFSRPAAG